MTDCVSCSELCLRLCVCVVPIYQTRYTATSSCGREEQQIVIPVITVGVANLAGFALDYCTVCTTLPDACCDSSPDDGLQNRRLTVDLGLNVPITIYATVGVIQGTTNLAMVFQLPGDLEAETIDYISYVASQGESKVARGVEGAESSS
jgi:hypothetical protein